MRETTRVCALLQSKRERFEEYEKETNALAACEIEEMEAHMRAREALRAEIDALDRRIEEQCAGEPRLLEAAQNRGNRGEMDAEAGEVYDCAGRVFAVASRVLRAEPAALLRMQRERDALEEKIKESNRSQAAQASRYFGGAGSGGPSRGPLGRA